MLKKNVTAQKSTGGLKGILEGKMQANIPHEIRLHDCVSKQQLAFLTGDWVFPYFTIYVSEIV